MPYEVLKRLEYRGQWLDPGDELPEPGRPKRVLITRGKIRWVSPLGPVYEPDPLTQRSGDRSIDHTFPPDPTFEPPPPPPRPDPPKVEVSPEAPSPFVDAPTAEAVAAKEVERRARDEEKRADELEGLEDLESEPKDLVVVPSLEEVIEAGYDEEEAKSIVAEERIRREEQLADYGLPSELDDIEDVAAKEAAPVGLLVDDQPEPDSGVEQSAAHVVHTHEDTGSSPVPATNDPESKQEIIKKAAVKPSPKPARKPKGKKKPRGKKRG